MYKKVNDSDWAQRMKTEEKTADPNAYMPVGFNQIKEDIPKESNLKRQPMGPDPFATDLSSFNRKVDF